MPIRRRSLLEKASLLQRGRLLSPARGGVSVARATSLEDLTAAYLLRGDGPEEGHADGDLGGARLVPHDASPETATFVARVGGEVVAAMSVVPDSPDLGLPSDGTFPRELGLLRAMHRWACEITMALPVRGRPGREAIPELVRACLAQALACGCDGLFVAVPGSLARLFEEVLQFEAWGRALGADSAQPRVVEGKRMDLRGLRQRLLDADRDLGLDAFLCDYYFSANPYHHSVRAWLVAAGRVFSDPEALRRLFVERSNLLECCSSREQEAIRGRWGDDLFEAVCPTYALDAALV